MGGGPSYKAAPSGEGSGDGMGRYSGYGMGGMGGGGYTDEGSPSNEGGIPMKYYVRCSPFVFTSLALMFTFMRDVRVQDPSDPSTYPTTTTPASTGQSGPSIHTTNNTIVTTSNTGSARPFSQNASTYGGTSHYSGLPEV